MKKTILFFSLILTLISFETKLFNDTVYNYYIDYTSTSKIVNNKDYYNSSNVKEIYSSKFNIIDKDTVDNYEDLINIYFTILNNNYKNYTFYCSDTYLNCLSDIENLDSDNIYFNLMNQFVKVYNSYESISSLYSSNYKVEVTVNKRYSEQDISKIDNEIERLMKVLKIDSYDNTYDKIKVFHDYIASINKYDEIKEQTGESIYHSDSAIGALFEGYAVCNGYADVLSIFLDKINVQNIKIANDTHVWNTVYLNNKWYHIDLTWDDPVTDNNKDIILYDYFMITTNELNNMKIEEHNFNKEIYDFIN